MSVINTNITSMIGQQNLSKSQNSLQTSMERLSSGLRINSAKDDAAGQAIANRMTSQITGLAQAQRNANDGISIAQTAEGGLNQINDNLQRVRELTVQAQNGTNSASDIDSIQQEVNQRLEEIDRIARETDFNGSKILSSATGTDLDIQVGSQDGQQIRINIEGNTSWNQYDATGTAASDLAEVGGQARTVDAKGFDVMSASAASMPTTDITVDPTGATLQNGGDTSSVVQDANGQLFIKDEVNAIAAVNYDETSSLAALTHDTLGTATSVGESSDGKTYAVFDDGGTDTYFEITVNPDGSGVFTEDFAAATGVTAQPADFAALTDGEELVAAEPATTTYYEVTSDMVDTAGGTNKITADISSLTGGVATIDTEAAANAEGTFTVVDSAATPVPAAGGPLEQLDNALRAVDEQRSQLGAIQNRFESAITNLQTNETNLSAARSRIEDADYATEVANMTKSQILQQAGTSVLAQANQIPQNVLSLLG